MSIYKPGAQPFWARPDKPGPEVAWQNARDRAGKLDQLRELKDVAMLLDEELREAQGTSLSRVDTVEHRLAEVEDDIDRLRLELGKPRRTKRPQVKAHTGAGNTTRRIGSRDFGGDGNGNRHVQACAPR